MSDNENNEEIGEFVTDKEYEEALAKLNTPTAKRRKKIAEEKKSKQSNRSKPTKEEFKKMSFIQKCVADPIIPISLLLALLAIIGAGIYIILPMALIDSFGMTLDEFAVKYEATETYQNLFTGYNLQIPEVTYIDSDTTETSETTAAADVATTDTSVDTTTETTSENAKFLNYFQAFIDSGFGTSIQGSTRKSDGELTALRVYVPYSGDNAQFMMYYFASFLETMYPDLTADTAADLVTTMFTNFDNSNLFTVRGNYAYRMVFLQSDGISSIAFDIIPAGNLNADQIATDAA